MYVIR